MSNNERFTYRAMRTVAGNDRLGELPNLTARELGESVQNVRAVVPSINQPVFADPALMNETGALIVATKMYETIKPRLTSP